MYDVVIVGGGPAGLVSAVYALRGGRSVVVIEKNGFGGQIAFSPKVENIPGTIQISGAEFADKLVEQVVNLGADLELEKVTEIKKEDGIFYVYTEEGNTFEGKTVILALGVKHRMLGLEGEEELVGRGVSYCAVCDGAFYHGRRVAVVGGGDTALQDALFLSATCAHVTLIHRRDQFRGEEKLVRQLQGCKNVDILLSHVPVSLESLDGELRGVALRDLKTGAEFNLPVEGLFLAVGQEPHNGQFADLIRLTAGGYVDAGEDCRTNVPGVFVAGDCRVKEVRQLTTAVGDGAVAALAACKYVDSL